MNIEVPSEEVEYLLSAIEARLRTIGKTYENSWAEDVEIASLRRVAVQCGVEFELSGGNTGFSVERVKA